MANDKTVSATAKDDGSMTYKKAIEDYKYAIEYKRKFLAEADNDFEFALGSQWEQDDLDELEKRGVLPVTVNEIKPIIRLLKGTESQNRSDAKAFPEGGEDTIEAEIATRLIKNAMKMDEGNYKISEVFGDGNICGESWIEPYLNYDNSLINADLGLRKADYWSFCWDPQAREYDLKDAQFFCKTTFDLTKEQLLSSYPDMDEKLLGDKGGKLTGELLSTDLDLTGAEIQKHGYQDDVGLSQIRPNVALYDLLEYYYKKYVMHFSVVDLETGTIKEVQSKTEADVYAETFNKRDPNNPTVHVVKRSQPEIWCMVIVGGVNEPITDEPAWSWPSWKSWPAIPYFAERWTARLKQSKRHLAVQGITRDLKDLNREKNKRRTQELRHLNQSANSGWLTPEGAWSDRKKVEEFGAVPGVNLEYDAAIGKPERIFPTPISQGHAQAAAEHSEDMKKASGINPDLLAAQEGGTDSGRAIALRQKQGLVMVQGFFDNLSRTKKQLNKFILSQLSSIYTIERAIRVVGDDFINQNFQRPVMVPAINPKTGQPLMDPSTGQPAQVAQVNPQTGQPVTQVDPNEVKAVFSKVLTDQGLALYDVAVGETISQDTVQMANFAQLTDLAEKGIPIPPDVIIDESLLSSSQKAKIKAGIARMAAQQPAKK